MLKGSRKFNIISKNPLFLEASRASGRRLGEFREGPWGRFSSFLVLWRRFWEVFGGSERVWNGFRRFAKGIRRFLEDFSGVRGGLAPVAGGDF